MNFYIKRIITLLVSLILVSFFTFAAFQIIPGDSALVNLGMEAEDDAIEAYKEELGLNRGIISRYVSWAGNAIKGDLGMSIKYDMKVTKLLGDRLPTTLWLAIMSFIITLLIAFPLGIICSKYQNKIVDRIILVVSQITMSIPSFFGGILITLVFGLIFRWFIPGNYVSIKEDFFGFVGYLIAPAFAIAIPKIAMVIRFIRSSVVRQKGTDYVRTAKSKGLNENEILTKHIFKNAMIPVVTFLGMVLADVLAGSIVIEQVFSLPGVGRLLVVSIQNRDFPVVQAIAIYIAVIVIVINAIVDVVYKHLDPRVKV